MKSAVEKARTKRSDIVWIDQMVDRKTATELYSHAAVFCCPSVYEPFGIINLEAMACETPVVASAVGGILEVVEDGKTGFLVPPARPDDLAAAIRRILDDRSEEHTSELQSQSNLVCRLLLE